MNEKSGYVYILTNFTDSVFYVGVTSDLIKRVWQHKHHVVDGFTSKYNVNKLVYFEVGEEIGAAIFREKQIKGYSRKKKIDLIRKKNPHFEDLFEKISAE